MTRWKQYNEKLFGGEKRNPQVAENKYLVTADDKKTTGIKIRDFGKVLKDLKDSSRLFWIPRELRKPLREEWRKSILDDE